MSRHRNPNECRIYVGNLPRDVRVRELQELFDTFGKIIYIDLKTRYSVPFAFIDYEDPRDARDACRKRNNYEMDGYPLIVEQPRGKSFQDRDRDHRGYGGGGGRRGYGGGGGYRGGRGYYDDRRRGGDRGVYRGSRYDDDEGGDIRPRFSVGYHVKITGLPSSTSWQDLKDLMREAGEVGYTDIRRASGTAIVQFHRLEDMKYAIKKFDDYEFTSSKGDKAMIRVREEETNKSPRRAGSGSRSPSRSRSRSPVRRRQVDSRSRSRSKSVSPRGRRGRPRSTSPLPPAAARASSGARRSFTPDEKRRRSVSRDRSRSRSRSSSARRDSPGK